MALILRELLPAPSQIATSVMGLAEPTSEVVRHAHHPTGKVHQVQTRVRQLLAHVGFSGEGDIGQISCHSGSSFSFQGGVISPLSVDLPCSVAAGYLSRETRAHHRSNFLILEAFFRQSFSGPRLATALAGSAGIGLLVWTLSSPQVALGVVGALGISCTVPHLIIAGVALVALGALSYALIHYYSSLWSTQQAVRTLTGYQQLDRNQAVAIAQEILQEQMRKNRLAPSHPLGQLVHRTRYAEDGSHRWPTGGLEASASRKIQALEELRTPS
jgi:hypothetical protein